MAEKYIVLTFGLAFSTTLTVVALGYTDAHIRWQTAKLRGRSGIVNEVALAYFGSRYYRWSVRAVGAIALLATVGLLASMVFLAVRVS
jgi:hypothetical protein